MGPSLSLFVTKLIQSIHGCALVNYIFFPVVSDFIHMAASLMPAKWVDLFDEMFADLHESHRWKLGRVDTNLVSAMKSFTGPIRLKAKNDSRSVSLWYRLTKKRAGQRLGKVLVSFEREIQTAADWLVEDVEEILFTVYEEISCKLYGRSRYEDPDPAERLWVIDPGQEQSRTEETEDWSESTLPSIWLDAFKQIFELKDWSLVPADRDPEDNTQPLEMNTRSGSVLLWLRTNETSEKVVLIRCNVSKKPPSKPMKEWRIIDIRRVLRTFRWNVETSDVVLENEKRAWIEKFQDIFNGPLSPDEQKWTLMIVDKEKRKMIHYSFRDVVFFNCLEVDGHSWYSSYGCASFWCKRPGQGAMDRIVYLRTYGQKCQKCRRMNGKHEKMGPEEYSPSEWDDNEKERVISKLHSKIGRILNPLTEGSQPVLVNLPGKWQEVFQKMFQCFEKHREITWTLHQVEANPPSVPVDQKLEMKTESGSISLLYQSRLVPSAEGSTSRVLLQFPENEKFPENWKMADIEIVLFAIYLLIRHHLKYGEYDVEDDLILIDMVMVHAETAPHVPQLCQACRLRRCSYLFKSRANQISRIYRRRIP